MSISKDNLHFFQLTARSDEEESEKAGKVLKKLTKQQIEKLDGMSESARKRWQWPYN